jgi:hypothetical protein
LEYSYRRNNNEWKPVEQIHETNNNIEQIFLAINVQVLEILSKILAMILGGVVGLSVHELTHHFFGRVWTDNIWIEGKYRFIPDVVDYGNPEELPSHGIRIAGGAPLIYPVLLLLTLSHWLSSMTVLSSFIMAISLGSSSISPFDFLAALGPDVWRKMAMYKPDSGHIEYIRLLLGASKINE